MTANLPAKLLFEVNNNMISDDDSAKKGTQLSRIEESCINKKCKKKLRFQYDQFISSKYVAVSWLKGKIYLWGNPALDQHLNQAERCGQLFSLKHLVLLKKQLNVDFM